MVDNYDLAQTIAVARKDAGLSQTELGEAAGVSRQTVSSIENGGCDAVSFGTVKRLVGTLGYELRIQHAPGLPVDIMGPGDAEKLWRGGVTEGGESE